MANYTTQANVVLSVNGKQASQMLKSLEKEAQRLEKQLAKAAGAGDKASMRKLQRELNSVNRTMEQLKGTATSVDTVLSRLDKASPKELNRTLKTLQQQLNGIQRGSAAWDAQIAKIQAVKAELQKVNATMAVTKSAGERALDFFNKWQVAIMGVVGVLTGLVMAGRKAVNAYAEMDESLANTMKFTGMTRAQVEDLNQALKEMDTRTARETLNDLAQEAGRLGKTSKQDVLGYVQAADIINVALSDLGQGATQSIAKLSNIFKIEDQYGTYDSMVKIGSVVNVLSQNCTASKPYLVEFANRLAGVGNMAHLSLQNIIGMGAVLDSNAQKVEASATAIGQVLTRMYRDPAKYAKVAGLDVQNFADLLKRDANEALLVFLETLGKAGDMDVLSPMFADMGENGARVITALSTLSKHIDEVRWQQENANKAFDEGTSVLHEYEIFNNTAQAGIDKAKKRISELSIELGEKLMPIMRHVYTSGSLFLRALSTIVDFVIENRKAIVTLTVAIGSYYAAIEIAKGLQLAWTAAVTLGTKAIGLFKYAVGLCEVVVIAFTHGLKAAGTAFTFLNQTMKTNAIGLVVSVLATLVTVIYNAVTATDKYKEAFDNAKKAASKFTEELMKEQREIDVLFGKLDAAKRGTKEYEIVKEQIISQYGKYLTGLINERGEITNLAEAYRRLGNMAKYAAQQRAIETATKQADEAYSEGLGTYQSELYDSLIAEGKSVREATALSQKVVIELTTTQTLSPETVAAIESVSKVNMWGGRAGWEDRAPSAIVNDMISLMGGHQDAIDAINDIQKEQRPFMKWSTDFLEKQVEYMQELADKNQGGRIIWGDTSDNPQVKNLSAKEIKNWLDQARWELYTRGATNQAPASPETPPGGGGGSKPDAPTKTNTSSTDKFEREKEWKAIQEALALIKKSQGVTMDEKGNPAVYSAYDYTAEMDKINIEFYRRILARQDLSNCERIENQAKYEEAIAKQSQDFNAKSIDSEDLYHREQLASIQQMWADNLITAKQYNKKTEDENVRHLGAVRDIYDRLAHWSKEQANAAAEMQSSFSGNVDLLKRPQIPISDLAAKGWDMGEDAADSDSYATLYSSQYGIKDSSGKNREILVTPILPDGSVLTEQEFEDYIFNILQGSDDILAADTKHIVIAVDVDPDGSAGERLHELQEAFYAESQPADPDAQKKYIEAQDNYLQLVNQIADRERKAAAELAKAHSDQLSKMRDFMLPKEKNDRDYKADLALLDEVYASELAACQGNAKRKLEIEEAYQIAKLALQKKYNQIEQHGIKGAIAKSAEWLQSDGGKALVGSMQVIGSGMSEIFSQVTSMMQADLESQTAAITKRYDREIELAEGNSYKVKKLEKQKEAEIAKAKNEANRKMFAMQVIQAVAQTATNALNAYGSAAAIPIVGHILAPIAAGMAIAAGMIQIAAIKKQQQASEAQGYQSGGFTPEGKPDEVAGVVHKGEWVASQALVNNPRTRPLLEALDHAQRTNTIGTISAADVSRTITAPAVLASRSADASPTIVNNTYQSAPAPENERMVAVLDRLDSRLNEPFVTVNTVSGDHGIQQAQEEYDRLMKNKSPKSKR